MSEAYEKLRKAKELEIESILQMHRAEQEDIINENFINEKATLDVQDGRSKALKEADK
jgi:hypothetical protein